MPVSELLRNTHATSDPASGAAALPPYPPVRGDSAGVGSGLLAAACVAAVALPWLVPTAAIPRLAGLQSLFGGVGVLALLSALALLPDRLRPARLAWPEVLLALFVVLGTVVVLQLPAATGRLWATLWWLEAFLVIVVLSRLADPSAPARCLNGYLLVAVLASAVFIAARAGLISGRLPFLIHQNHFALLLLLPILVCLQRLVEPCARQRPGTLAPALLIMLVALLLTQSRAAWAGAMAGMVVVGGLFIRRRLQLGRLGSAVLMLLPVAGMILILLVDRAWVALGHDSLLTVLETFRHLDEGSIGGRLRRWDNALLLIREHWLGGVGLGNWAVAYGNYRHLATADAGGSVSALSTYVQILAETGIAGLLLFLGFVATALGGALRRGAPAGLVAAVCAWLVALAFHSVYDFKLPLLGFAFTMGLLLWPAAAGAAERPARRATVTPALLALAGAVLFVADARYAIAELERVSVAETAAGMAQERRLWRLVDPLSRVIDPPMSRERLLERADALVAANRFQPPGEDDFLLVLADLAMQRGAPDAALQWTERALRRNPASVHALTRACRIHESAGRTGAARQECLRSLRANPAQPEVRRALARLEIADGRPQAARGHLDAARTLLEERLGKNNFGRQTRDLVSRQYAALRSVNQALLALRSGPPLSPLEHLEEIARTPSLHKSVTSIGCHLYFSANLNQRYNLWRLDLCADADVAPRIMTNDSRAPFRLRSDGAHVYFMADSRGDNRFDLYRFDPRGGATRMMPRPRGLLLEYSPAPDGSRLALVVHRRGAFRLYVGDPESGDYREVLTSRRPFSEPLWYPQDAMPDVFLVIEGGRRLHRVAASSAATEVLLEDPQAALAGAAVAPDGRRIVYTRRTGARASSLHLLDTVAGPRTLLASTTSVIADPLWRDAGRVLFREVLNDEYLLREVSLADLSVRPLGPGSGVVYQVHQTGLGLLFAAADATTPASLYRIAPGAGRARQLLRFDAIPADSVIVPQRRVIDPAEDVVSYRYRARDPRRNAVVLWLHGGSNRFSPRWHPYAQYFAAAGFEFLALNYREPWPRRAADHQAQAEDVARRVEALRREGFDRIFLAGVSTGTQIIQAYVRADLDEVDGIIEYSPVDNDGWRQPRLLPPLLSFTGANDPLLDHAARLDAIRRHREAGSAIDWIVYDDEGHDLRGRDVIAHRMLRTLTFLDTLSGRRGPGQRLVAEVPGLDQNAPPGR